MEAIEGGADTDPVIVCTDPTVALSMLSGGAAAQTSPLGAEIWRLLTVIAVH